ncbi:pantoate--beta-alanine ligase [Thermophagus xiamenensis]|jgi:pantoate--beta-alanine ligase|uniref:Pantothenate synthetase n=1 Tax=Thermophagus xiamenensis TaxID=385682 RepID=A0A1I1X7D0_9BACT|nr:pantoate--beta-alanine ligase [Thermophagus xiamenensis]SFE03101.1 pantothenate synthetase [Thermophagus xiamenensis]
MHIVRTREELDEKLSALKKSGIVGFVPTMGALHEGHLSLVRQARRACDIVVVSIFVNPTQFNDPKDLERYPRNLEEDIRLLKTVSCELLFAPTVEEVYPEPDTRVFDFGQLDKVMEGQHRPGHFNGVAQVLSRFFDMIKPDKAFFGQKDFQQLVIVRHLVRQLKMDIEIVGCPIVREPDGLAMSSRNRLLTEKQRKSAPLIAKTLIESCNFAKNNTVEDTINFVSDTIKRNEDLKLEYFQIVNGNTLQPVDNWDESSYIVGCIAVFVGEIRLIDNVIYKDES